MKKSKNLDIFRTIGRNVKANATMTNLKKAGWGAAGAALYALIPTAIQGWGKTDSMTGWKGWGTGFVAANLIGMAFNKPEMMVGASAMAVGHLMYVKGNPTIANVFNSPIFSFSSTTPNLPASEASLKDKYLAQLNDRYSPTLSDDNQRLITLPDGTQVLASTGPVPQLETATSLNDYYSEMPSEMPTSVLEKSYGLNDARKLDYEQLVANGAF